MEKLHHGIAVVKVDDVVAVEVVGLRAPISVDVAGKDNPDHVP